MKAYAVLAGGGVKGAALAGCLQAAEDHGIEFVGYGGASAGAIVALLASVGYTGHELESIMIEEIDFKEFLDDGGVRLNHLKDLGAALERGYIRGVAQLVTSLPLIRDLSKDLGLYQGHNLRTFLAKKIEFKLPNLSSKKDVSFDDLLNERCKSLKIIAADLEARAPKVYPGGGNGDTPDSVFVAVRASMSYPFVFKPVRDADNWLVDGGLSSNLPVFLFERERMRYRFPVIAFDLKPPGSRPKQPRGSFKPFIKDMLATALKSGDSINRDLVRGLFCITVETPDGIDTLDFGISRGKRKDLFNAGYATASKELGARFRRSLQGWTAGGSLRAAYAHEQYVAPLLEAFATQVSGATKAESLRTYIMLPSELGTLVAAYHYGKENDTDVRWELESALGSVGESWFNAAATVADLIALKKGGKDYRHLPVDRQSMFSTPIFFQSSEGQRKNVLGVLVIDSSTPLKETGWIGDKSEWLDEISSRWATVLARILE